MELQRKHVHDGYDTQRPELDCAVCGVWQGSAANRIDRGGVINKQIRSFAGSAATLAAVVLLAGPALADGYRGSIKDAPKPEERCKHSANVALTTEYVFRGISQTKEGPAIQGGYGLTCNIFYAGVWASNLDWGGTGLFGFPGNEAVANIEMDWYLGIKPVTGRITWDLGVIYYTYPNSAKLGFDALGAVDRRNYNYLELKVGASAAISKDGTVGWYRRLLPDYQYPEAGSVWTTECSWSTQVFPKFNALHRDWTPSFSALLGWQKATSDMLAASAASRNRRISWRVVIG